MPATTLGPSSAVTNSDSDRCLESDRPERPYWMRKTVITVVSLFLIVSGAIQPSAPASIAARASTRHPPVILIHGYNNKGTLCEGIKLDSYWGATKVELTQRRGIPAPDVIPVSFYQCDTGGIDITGYGPRKNHPLTTTSGASRPRAGYTTRDSIVQIAHDLAWFVHNKFTQRGETVYVIGHSMGGLIIREALRRVQAGDRAFPSVLDVSRALTVSTPHAGWSKDCSGNTQCSEMTPGSRFLAELRTNRDPQGVGGTRWWAMATEGDLVGSLPCDGITTESATAIRAIRLIYADPCYRHSQYLNDDEQTPDAEGSAALRGRHSVSMMGHIVK